MTRGAVLQWSLLPWRPLTSVARAVIHRFGVTISAGKPVLHQISGGTMSSHEIPDVPVWSAVLDELAGDDRVTPQLQGFLSLAVPQGDMGGTL
jgi:hypothetical protein